VLDLACGTGSLSVLLAKKGYRVLAADASEDMLAMAWEKASELEQPPYFICQRMEQLRLPYGVDWVACCLDSLNYLTDPKKLARAIGKVGLFMEPGGVFLFDALTPAHFREIDGVDYVALLEIPQLEIALPVAAGWDGENLSDAPRRFSGSSYDHSLVIGGADHAGQFAFCDQIGHDTRVTVTDMTGARFSYEVVRIDRRAHAEVVVVGVAATAPPLNAHMRPFPCMPACTTVCYPRGATPGVPHRGHRARCRLLFTPNILGSAG
jgi:hypothetical protein